MISISSPSLFGNEKKYVNDCLDRGELSWRGSYIARFEEEFARFCGVEYAVSCCNGTAALHLAMLALGIGVGDDVFLPALTYVATANAIRYVGANPVFCDVDRMTWTLEVQSVEEAIDHSRCPKAILPVHLYGVPCDMSRLDTLAEAYQLDVVEDAAEAHGSMVDTFRVGALGDIGVFSFFANKLLTTGEGGMLTTNNVELYHRARLFRGQGQTPGRQFYHEVVGYNYRMTNLQAALGLAQLETFDQHATAHEMVSDIYRRELRGKDFEFQRALKTSSYTPWLFTVLLPEGVERAIVMKKMLKAGVETRPIFEPMTDLPIYSGTTPSNCAEISRRGICLPTHGRMTINDAYRVVEVLIKAVR
jgi:perosamine synthetase